MASVEFPRSPDERGGVPADRPTGVKKYVPRDRKTGEVPSDRPTGVNKYVPQDRKTGSVPADRKTDESLADPITTTEKVVQAAHEATETAKKTAGGLKTILVWTVPVLALLFSVFMIFKGESVSGSESPEKLMDTYSLFVRPYLTPSQATPENIHIDQWLDYFDEASRTWFERNVDKLSYYPLQNNPAEWYDYTSAQKRSHAMKYVLTIGPLKGGTVETANMMEEGYAANVVVRSGGLSSQFRMRRTQEGWKIEDLMGQRLTLEEQLKDIRIPRSRP